MSLLHKLQKQKRNNDPLIRLITPMIAGVLVCTICLVSMTWAWFTASVSVPVQTIQSATRSTAVMVYEINQPQEKNENSKVTKKLIKPEISQPVPSAKITQEAEEDVSMVVAGESVVWTLSPEKSYEVKMTGDGTASTGYCKIALSHTVSGNKIPETKIYQTSNFEKEHTVKFTYNTGGFSDTENVTETQWKEYVEKTTPPTLTIASYWGEPPENTEPQPAATSAEGSPEEIILLSDGDVLGLVPIPCPEAKAETEIELEGFEIQEGAVISAKEDYNVSLMLKEGYEMPGEVLVNIDGKDYIVSTQSTHPNEELPYFDAQTGVLTVPSALLSDGVTVSVKAKAEEIPAAEIEEKIEEEMPVEESTGETEDNSEEEKTSSSNIPSDDDFVADDPSKKEEDGDQDNNESAKTPVGDGGNDDDDDTENDNNTGASSDDNSSSDNGEENTEAEKADVTLKLSQLTINLEETKIPTNADLVLTLSAKEDMTLPKQIVITLDKTIRDENIDDNTTNGENITNEEIEEDKTSYTINTDGEDNPEGFVFDTESGKLTISSKLLEGVREITISDTKEGEADENEDEVDLTFEVKNLTFDFADEKVATDEDVIITFTAGEGYELPETITITIDGEVYTIYTSTADSGENPEGITFDAETGMLTISKDLLEDAEEMTITAEGVKKDDENTEENPDGTGKDDDKDPADKENGNEGDEVGDKEPDNGTDNPPADDNTEDEGKTETGDGESGENDSTTPETDPDNNTEKDDTGVTDPTEPDDEPTTPADPDDEGNTEVEPGTEGEGGAEGETGTEGEGSAEVETGTEGESGAEGETGTEGGDATENGNGDLATDIESDSTLTDPATPADPGKSEITSDKEDADTSNTETSENNDVTNGLSDKTVHTEGNSSEVVSTYTQNTENISDETTQESDATASSDNKQTSVEE